MNKMTFESNKLLTAIIPVARMAGKLDRLEKLLTEVSNTPISIILVHDFQDYKTEEEILRILSKRKDGETKFVSITCNGPGKARNFGLNLLETDWVTFWDSDDEPNIEEVLIDLKLLIKSGKSIGIAGFLEINDKTGNQIPKNFNQNLIANFISLSRNPGMWRWIFKSSLLSESKFIDSRMGEDQVFLAQNFTDFDDIQFFPNAIYSYHTHQNTQLTASRQALGDIPKSMNQILTTEKFISKEQELFSQIIFIRMYITYISRVGVLKGKKGNALLVAWFRKHGGLKGGLFLASSVIPSCILIRRALHV